MQSHLRLEGTLGWGVFKPYVSKLCQEDVRTVWRHCHDGPWIVSGQNIHEVKALNEPYFTNDPIFRSFALKRSSTRILGTSVTLQHSWKQYHTLPDKPFSGQNCGHHTCLAVIGWPGRQYCRQNCGSSHTISLEIKIIRRRLRCICTRQGSNTLCLWPNDYAR